MFYLEAAAEFHQGNGLAIPFGYARRLPLTHFPPVYPLLIAAGLGAGIPADVFVVRLNDLCLLLELCLVMWMVFRWSGSILAATSSVVFLAAQKAFLLTHSYALSEPLFLVLLALYFVAFLEHLAQGSRWSLFLAALVLSVAVLTRYAGLFLAAAGAIAILLATTEAISVRLRKASSFIVVSCLPFAALAVYNSSISHSATNRALSWHPPPLWFLRQGMERMGSWALPDLLPRALSFLLAAALLAGVIWLACRQYYRLRRLTAEACLVLHALVYLACLIASISIADEATPLSPRILAPVLMLFSVAAGLILACMPAAGWRRLAICVAAMVWVTAINLPRLSAWTGDQSRDWLGWTRPSWVRSGLWEALAMVPAGVRLYSNAPDLIYHYTKRPSYWFAPPAGTAAPHPAFVNEVAMRRDLAARTGWAVLLPNATRWAGGSYSLAQLQQRYGLQVVARFDDGYILAAPEQGNSRVSPEALPASPPPVGTPRTVPPVRLLRQQGSTAFSPAPSVPPAPRSGL